MIVRQFIRNNKNITIYSGLFISAIAIHWIIMWLSYGLLGSNDSSGMLGLFYERYSKCGDASHYINIAANGYYSSGEYANQIVFYPLYPLLMRIVSYVAGDYFISGVIISNICLGVSACALYKLTVIELGEERAYDSVAVYLLYPFGVFTVATFTESLFLMLVLVCLVCIRQERWIAAGVTGMLAALSRSQGIALFVPAVYESIMYMIRCKRFKARCIASLLIPAGTFIYLLINKIVQGDFMAFVAHEEAEPWYNVPHWISVNLEQHYNMALDSGSLAYIIYWVQLFLYFLGIVLLFYGIRKRRRTSLIAYGGAYMFLSYLHGWLISGPRYMMGCVTLYIIYASVDNRYVKNTILAVSGILVIFYTLGSWQGQAIM